MFQNEITQAFERGAQKYPPEPPKRSKQLNNDIAPEKTDIEDIDLEFLIQINETIKSDISELLAKNELNNNFDNDINGFSYINGNKLYEDAHFDEKHLCEADLLSDTIGSDSLLGNSVSTNLTHGTKYIF